MTPRLLWRRVRVFAGVALALSLVGLFFWLFAVNWRPSPRDFAVQGVDVSETQGPINWWTARESGIQFAYARATMGAHGRDRRFAQYWRGLFQAGIPHGAIHVFSLCQLAADQAGNFVSRVPASADQLPAALELDFEPGCAARPAREVVLGEINRFLTGVEAHLGKPMLLKMSSRFDDWYHVSAALPRPLWAAQAFFPPADFDKPWTMWQASSFRRIDGVTNPVNWDVKAP